MSREENIEVVKRWFAALKNVDMETYFSLFDPDVEWRMIGNTCLSGTWRGKEGIQDVATQLFSRFVPGECSWGETYRIVCADENGVVVLDSGGGKSILGRDYNQTYVHIFKIRNGLFYRVYEFFDTVLTESALYGNELQTPEKKPAVPLDFLDEPVV
jgi:uncharacterized protein